MKPANKVTRNRNNLHKADEAKFRQMLLELGMSKEEVAKTWNVVEWMMKRIYEPNTISMLNDLQQEVTNEIGQAQGGLDQAKANIDEAFENSKLSISKQHESEEIRELKRLAGLD